MAKSGLDVSYARGKGRVFAREKLRMDPLKKTYTDQQPNYLKMIVLIK